MELATLQEPAAAAAATEPFALSALEPLALAATRAAALACQRWIGRGDPKAADQAATEAMRRTLACAPGTGTVVVGEGAKDDAPMLFDGERLGSGAGPEFDIAVDPLECTKLCARGLPGSLATIAFAAPGTIASLAASFYMDKLVGPAAVRGALELSDPPESTVARAAAALNREVEQLRVIVLDKPRHESLIQRLQRAGAEVATPTDGDVAGALAALLPDGDADLLMGIGGTPEGVMTACAVRALGGFMQARLAPQRAGEAEAIAQAGLSAERLYSPDELVAGESFFVATGVTGGGLLRRPWLRDGHIHTESIVIGAGSVRRVIHAEPAGSALWPPAQADGSPANGRSQGT